jgi:hypothetical protein
MFYFKVRRQYPELSTSSHFLLKSPLSVDAFDPLINESEVQYFYFILYIYMDIHTSLIQHLFDHSFFIHTV